MAHFECTEGQPGQGKSLYMAMVAESLFIRNKKWYEETGIKRIVASNMKFAEHVEKENEGWYIYWTDISELKKLRNVDILWDEIATDLDARNWPNLDNDIKTMLSQYRKRGLDIYANTQDFSMVDVRARLMITRVQKLRKLMGSPDPSTTKPKIEKIWGIVLIRRVVNHREKNLEKFKYDIIPSGFLIRRKYVEMYDTTQDIPQSKYAPLKHVERYCEDPNCTLHHTGKVMHY